MIPPGAGYSLKKKGLKPAGVAGPIPAATGAGYSLKKKGLKRCSRRSPVFGWKCRLFPEEEGIETSKAQSAKSLRSAGYSLKKKGLKPGSAVGASVDMRAGYSLKKKGLKLFPCG